MHVSQRVFYYAHTIIILRALNSAIQDRYNPEFSIFRTWAQKIVNVGASKVAERSMVDANLYIGKLLKHTSN